jgi:hypothetical protein
MREKSLADYVLAEAERVVGGGGHAHHVRAP